MAKYKALVDITVAGKKFEEGATITSKISKECTEFLLENELIEEISASNATGENTKDIDKNK